MENYTTIILTFFNTDFHRVTVCCPVWKSENRPILSVSMHQTTTDIHLLKDTIIVIKLIKTIGSSRCKHTALSFNNCSKRQNFQLTAAQNESNHGNPNTIRQYPHDSVVVEDDDDRLPVEYVCLCMRCSFSTINSIIGSHPMTFNTLSLRKLFSQCNLVSSSNSGISLASNSFATENST